MFAETKAVQIHSFGRPEATSSTSVYTTPGFWERLWRMSGISFLLFSVIAYIIYPHSQAGASPEALVALYSGDHLRFLIAAVVSGMAILNLVVCVRTEDDFGGRRTRWLGRGGDRR